MNRASSLFLMGACLAQLNGQTWSYLGTPPPGNVRQVLPLPDRIVAGTTGGIYITTDSGATWQASDFVGDIGATVNTLTVTPDGQTLFCGTTNAWWEGSLLVSSNGGLNWDLYASADGAVRDIAAFSSDSVAYTFWWDLIPGGVAITTNGGNSWGSYYFDAAGGQALAWNRMDPSKLLAGTEVELFLSTDGGTTFSSQNQPEGSVESLDSRGNLVVAAPIGSGSILISEDFGSIWIAQAFDLPDLPQVSLGRWEGGPLAYAGGPTHVFTLHPDGGLIPLDLPAGTGPCRDIDEIPDVPGHLLVALDSGGLWRLEIDVEPEPCCDPGDVNCDGEVNVLDIVLVVNCILGTGTGESCACADFNTDGDVNVLDIVGMVNLILEG